MCVCFHPIKGSGYKQEGSYEVTQEHHHHKSSRSVSEFCPFDLDLQLLLVLLA